MSIKDFINKTDKYHYLIVINKKVATIATGNKSSETKKKCL